MLMGFPSPVANVHLLAARAEASLARAHGERRQKAAKGAARGDGRRTSRAEGGGRDRRESVGTPRPRTTHHRAPRHLARSTPHGPYRTKKNATNRHPTTTNKTQGAASVGAPLALDVEFKKPTLLPNTLSLSAAPGGQAWPPKGAGGSLSLRLDDKKGRPIFVADARKKAERV